MNINFICVKVIPASKKTSWGKTLADGTRKLYIKSAPVKGKANQESIEFLSQEFRVPKNKIKTVKGAKSRYKLFKIVTPLQSTAKSPKTDKTTAE